MLHDHIAYIHHAQWWTSPIHMDGSRVIPTAPFQSYDPFSFYYRSTAAKRDHRSVLYEFLTTNPSSPESVLGFTRRFGVLGDRHGLRLIGWQLGKEEINHPTATIDPFSRAGQTRLKALMGKSDSASYGVVSAVPTATSSLCVPMSLEEFQRRHKVFHVLITLALEASRLPLEDAETIRGVLASQLSILLAQARPSLVWQAQQRQWALHWEVGTLDTILAIMLMLDLQRPGSVRSCARCEDPFFAIRLDTLFCSSRCQQLMKLHRFRRKDQTSSPRPRQKRAAKSR